MTSCLENLFDSQKKNLRRKCAIFFCIQTASNGNKFSSYPATSKNTRPSNTAAINSKHIWIRKDDHNLNTNKIHSAAISSSSIPNNNQRKKQNHFAIKYDPAFDKFHRSKYKIVNVKSVSGVANNHYEPGSTNELKTNNAFASPTTVCTFDLNETNINRTHDKSKYKYVNTNNLMDVQANEK